jgi:biopolymer transport protein TolQ
MEIEALKAVELAGSATHDLSLWGLFLQADLVVKTVMVLLLMASVWCWAIIFEKVRRIKRVTAQAEKFESEFWSGGSLEKLHDRIGVNPDHPLAVLFSAVMREWRRSAEPGRTLTGSVQTRIGQVMRVSIDREMERLESHIGFLASVGSTAPFVGLFGTVWGIMNSFSSIAMSKNTSLVVVAPGIAEALFATALGLLAAIPAVIAYNKISHDLARYNNRLETFAGEFATILSRQIDEGGN